MTPLTVFCVFLAGVVIGALLGLCAGYNEGRLDAEIAADAE